MVLSPAAAKNAFFKFSAMSHEVPAVIQKSFYFENKAPADVQIQFQT
jgi:hypothetical protein